MVDVVVGNKKMFPIISPNPTTFTLPGLENNFQKFQKKLKKDP
jgi:hypothetical protein